MHSENNENEIQDAEDGAIDDEPAVVEIGTIDPDQTVVMSGDEQTVIDPEQTVVMSEDSFADPDISMEVNVEKLVAELDGAEGDEAHRKAEIRRRLEELTDEGGDFEDTYAIDLKDD